MKLSALEKKAIGEWLLNPIKDRSFPFLQFPYLIPTTCKRCRKMMDVFDDTLCPCTVLGVKTVVKRAKKLLEVYK